MQLPKPEIGIVKLKQTRFGHVCKLFGGFLEINCSEVTLLFKLLIHGIIHHLHLCHPLPQPDFLVGAHAGVGSTVTVPYYPVQWSGLR
jgi:hypothetical protein